MNALLQSTDALIRSRHATPREMQRFLGRWVWPLLLRRPLLSVLSELYCLASLKRPHVPRRLNVPQLTELQALIGLAPVVFRDLTRPVSTRIYATDASPWGAGVVYLDEGGCGQDLVALFRDARVLTGWYAFPDMPPDVSEPLTYNVPATGREQLLSGASDISDTDAIASALAEIDISIASELAERLDLTSENVRAEYDNTDYDTAS